MIGCLCLMLFDFKAAYKLEQYNPKGVAHYDLSYDLLFPSPDLINRGYIDAIKRFPRRDTVVLVGNSVIAGVGSEDKVLLHKKIATSYNVINAGLPGEYFPASLALAAMGIKEAAENQPDSVFHIFIAYPATRLYLFSNESGYWVTGPALATLANENKMEGYIFKGKGLIPMGMPDQVVYKIKNYFVMNMRCIINRPVIMDSLQRLKPYCLEAISSRDVGGDVPFIINIKNNSSALNFLESETGRFSAVGYRNGTLDFLDEKVQFLTSYLEARKLKYKFYFLLLGDPPGLVEKLPQDVRQRYQEARSDYVDSIRLHKSWIVEDINSFATSDYFDASHLNQNGQLKLASKILDLIAGQSEHVGTH